MLAKELCAQLLACDQEKPVCINIVEEVYVSEPYPEIDKVEEEKNVILLDF